MKIVQFSCGVSSAIALYLSKNVDLVQYIHIDDQHEDSLRFLHDVEKLTGHTIEILQSYYKNVDNVLKLGWIKSIHGAPCTDKLKRRVRKEWEIDNIKNKMKKDKNGKYPITYVWGFDYEEKHRADRLVENLTEYYHEFPLIEKQLTKNDIHAIAQRIGLKRPLMYDLGYSNNNCIGCVKGGMGYWNKIRADFPEVFESRAKREREVGHSILKDKNGAIWLDELDPNKGRMEDEISQECSIFCMLNLE